MDCKGSKKDEALKSMILKLSYKFGSDFPAKSCNCTNGYICTVPTWNRNQDYFEIVKSTQIKLIPYQ